MTSGVVARSDTVYKAVPDLARATDGTLVCVYRESLFHLYHPFSRLVQYIVDDAPMAHIRSYRVSRDDWILYPEGELPRIEKVDPPASEMHRYDRSKNVIYHDAALALSARRFKEQP